MKLRNKKTGEIVDFSKGNFISSKDYGFVIYKDGGRGIEYNSLAELNEEWEDYEKPKPQVVYYIDRDGEIVPYKNAEYPKSVFNTEQNKEIGNYFETEEEAEKAVEKLKAWKRLKDKGFEFKYWTYKMDEPKIENHTYFMIVGVCEDGIRFDDLDLLFGGEE